MVRRILIPALLLAAPAAAQPRADTAVHRLDSVRVQVSRLQAGGVPLARAPFAAQALSAAEIRNERPLTLADVLTRLPGVSASDATGSAGQPALVLRGFTASPVMGMPQGVSVFVDGVRVNEPDASQVHWDLLPLSDVERVEVVRGPSGPFGKNTLAGAILVTTRRGGEGAEAEAAAGSFGRLEGRASVGGQARGFDWRASGRYLRSGGWREGAFTRMAQTFARVGWRGPATDVSLSWTFADDSLLQAGALPRSWLADPGAVPERWRGGDVRRVNFTAGDFFGPRMHFVNARVEHALAPGLGVSANAFVRRTDVAQFNANFTEPDTRIATRNRSAGGVAQLAYEAGRATLLAGAELTVSGVQIGIFEHPNENFPELEPDGEQTEDVGTREWSSGAFVQARVAATPRLAFTGSVRYDHVVLPFRDRLDPSNDGDNRFRQLTGTAAVDYVVAPRAVVFGGWGRGFRAPVILELACADPEDPCPLPYELGADPPLRPVVADTWHGGARWLGARLTAEAAAYRAEVRDDIFSVQPAGARVGYFQNLERTRREGLELSATARPTAAWEVRGSLAWTRATFQTTATLSAPFVEEDEEEEAAEDEPDALEPPTVRPGDRLPLVPEVHATLGAQWTGGRWRVGADWRYVGAQWLPGNEDNRDPSARVHPYALVDARASRRVGRVRVRLDVRNVFDARHETFGVLALNRLDAAVEPHVEPFLTPGLPRRVELSASLAFR